MAISVLLGQHNLLTTSATGIIITLWVIQTSTKHTSYVTDKEVIVLHVFLTIFTEPNSTNVTSIKPVKMLSNQLIPPSISYWWKSKKRIILQLIFEISVKILPDQLISSSKFYWWQRNKKDYIGNSIFEIPLMCKVTSELMTKPHGTDILAAVAVNENNMHVLMHATFVNTGHPSASAHS